MGKTSKLYITKAEKLRALEKVAPNVRSELIRLVEIDKEYTWTEIGDMTGIGRTHASDLAHGNEPLRETYIEPLIATEILSMGKILNNVNFDNATQERFVRKMKIMENDKLVNVVDLLEEYNEDAAAILEGYAFSKGLLKKDESDV